MRTFIFIILSSLPFLGFSQSQSTYERNTDGSVDVYRHDYRGTTHEATYERNVDGSVEKYEYRNDGAKYRSSTIEENADGSYTETHHEEPPRTYDDMMEQNRRRQSVGREGY